MNTAALLLGTWLATWGTTARPPTDRSALWSTLPSPAPTVAWGERVQRVSAAKGGHAYFPAGSFVMGSTPSEMLDAVSLCAREILRERCEQYAPLFRAEGRAHKVTLSAFSLDRTEVTVRDYLRCVAAGACAPLPSALHSHHRPLPSHPVTNVRWDDAQAYCRFRGGRLPTEAEWERAARGTSRRIFPWGNVYSPRLSNHGALAQDMTDGTDGFYELAPVGSYPDGRTEDGVFDLAGNAAEWVADYYDLDEKGFGYAPQPVRNPHGPKGGPLRIVRGGSYTDAAPWLRAAARIATSFPRAAHIGFRCAYDGRGP